MNLFCRELQGVAWLEQNVGDDGRVGGGGLMGAEADADVEGLVEVQGDGRAKLMHGLALEADEDGEGVAVLFDSDAFGVDAGEQAA